MSRKKQVSVGTGGRFETTEKLENIKNTYHIECILIVSNTLYGVSQVNKGTFSVVSDGSLVRAGDLP